MASGANGEHHHQPQQFFAPQYQVIPAGAIPVSTINIDPSQICPVDQMGMWTLPPPTGPNGMRYGIPIPAPLVPQITSSIMEASKMTSSTHTNATILNAMTASTSSNDSSSESGVSGVKEAKDEKKKSKIQADEKLRHEERQSTSDYTDDDPIPFTSRRSITGSVSYNYAEQIAERRRVEQQQEDRERQEMLEVERQRRVLEDRRNSEEEIRKQAELDRVEKDRLRMEQAAAAMEKARKEAELAKRARIYKHVFRGAEEEGGTEQLEELEQKILGVDIETGRRLLKEVSEVEWHKKQDEAEIRKNAPPQSDRSAHNLSSLSSGNQSARGRSSSISSPCKPDTSFTRNSIGRRSVRTTSREKQQESPKSSDQAVQHPLAASTPVRRPPRQPQALPTQDEIHVAREVPLANKSTTPSPTRSEMLRSAAIYCPINRDPLSQREELRAINRSTSNTGAYHNNNNNNNSKFEGAGVSRYNEITQTALFGPIATRNSIRRGTMRGTGLPSPPSVRVSTQNHQNQQRTSSFDESSSGGEEGGSISPDLGHKNFESPLPSSTENVHPASNSPPMKQIEGFEFKTPTRARSALSSPMSNFMNGGDNDSPISRPASRLMQRLEQKGTIRRDDEIISQEIRRVAETNLSRSPSLASLRGSMSNLAFRASQLNLAGTSGELPPNLTKFASVNSPARQSLSSMKKTTDRQAAVLERLGRLRESLHAGKNYTPPRNGISSSSRITTPAQTPPISPRPVM